MFDKFGEMNSYTEINELAANLLQEGDLDSLKELAKENGIPDDYVEMYLEEAIPSLCDSTSAAIGKIDVECMKLKPKELMLDWVEYIKGLCMENEMIAHQVRKKGKTLQGCMRQSSMQKNRTMYLKHPVPKMAYRKIKPLSDIGLISGTERVHQQQLLQWMRQ